MAFWRVLDLFLSAQISILVGIVQLTVFFKSGYYLDSSSKLRPVGHKQTAYAPQASRGDFRWSRSERTACALSFEVEYWNGVRLSESWLCNFCGNQDIKKLLTLESTPQSGGIMTL